MFRDPRKRKDDNIKSLTDDIMVLALPRFATDLSLVGSSDKSASSNNLIKSLLTFSSSKTNLTETLSTTLTRSVISSASS